MQYFTLEKLKIATSKFGRKIRFLKYTFIIYTLFENTENILENLTEDSFKKIINKISSEILKYLLGITSLGVSENEFKYSIQFRAFNFKIS